MHRKLFLTFMLLLMLIAAACGGASTPTVTVEPTTAPPSDVPAQAETEAVIVPTEAPTDVATEAVTEPAAAEDEADATEVTTGDPASSTASESELTEAVAVVGFDRTAARSGPGTSFEAVAEVRVNETLPIYAKTGEGTALWYLVQLSDGQSAWLWSRVVRIEPEDAAIPEAENVPAL